MTLAWPAPATERWKGRHARFLPANPERFVRSLKICLISEPLHAGVGRHVADSACALAARGHEIHLLYSPRRLDPDMLEAVGRQPNIRSRAIDMPQRICRGDLSAFRKIRDYIRANGPFDIIHGESSKGGAYARLLNLFGRGATIYSPHAFVTFSPVLPPLKRRAYGMIELMLAHLTDKIICSSQAECEHARSLGIPASKLEVIVNGGGEIPVSDRDLVRTALGFAKDEVVVGFVGRMEDQKAPQRLIEAALRLLPLLPKLRLLMIGDGAKRAALEARLRESGFADRVIWLGAVNARLYMSTMDAFVLPSLYEGFAYVLIEALYAGLPIVSTPVGGTHEAIDPEANGFIVPHGATDAMADAILKLVTNEKLRGSMAEASRARAGRFVIDHMVNRIEELYRNQAASQSRHLHGASLARSLSSTSGLQASPYSSAADTGL